MSIQKNYNRIVYTKTKRPGNPGRLYNFYGLIRI